LVKHFVFTRLGIGIYNEAWHEHRLDLFEAVTLPSMLQQSSKDFAWLVAIDSNMPLRSRARLGQLLQDAPHFHMVSIDITRMTNIVVGGLASQFDYCRDYIMACGLIDDTREVVITSRIDDDDAWNRDVVAIVNTEIKRRMVLIEGQRNQGDAKAVVGLVLTLPRGLAWFIPNNVLQLIEFPFLANSIFVAARLDSGFSVASIDHYRWPQYAETFHFDVARVEPERPMWVYTRHDRTTMQWQAVDLPAASQPPLALLKTDFAIDLERIAKFRSRNSRRSDLAVGVHGPYVLQLQRIRRISALNRQIELLTQDEASTGTHTPQLTDIRRAELLERCKSTRAELLAALRHTGSTEFG
jgi:Putative rhamnosyl transferase